MVPKKTGIETKLTSLNCFIACCFVVVVLVFGGCWVVVFRIFVFFWKRETRRRGEKFAMGKNGQVDHKCIINRRFLFLFFIIPRGLYMFCVLLYVYVNWDKSEENIIPMLSCTNVNCNRSFDQRQNVFFMRWKIS